ncbi:class I SAM-dependent DNA methyltransferase [Glycomyces tarimensis]
MSEPSYLRTTRSAYDSVAEEYAERFRGDVAEHPLHGAMMGAFAELVRESGSIAVADVGCGPGHVTAHLHGLGLDAFGVDLSPEMLAIARRDHPGLRFTEGSLTGLGIADGALAGLVSRFSIIHTPPERLPEVFAEFHRVLAPGGRLLMSCFAEADESQLAWPFDHKVALAYRLSIGRVAELLTKAGFDETARLIEQPGPDSLRGFEYAHFLFAKAA